MTDQHQAGSGRGGDRRGRDRRTADRRKQDRRSPVPWWRRPAAYVAYGALGTVLLVLFVAGRGESETDPMARAAEIEQLAMISGSEEIEAEVIEPPATRDAYTLAQFERLLAEGDEAMGQIVRTELYCESIRPVNVRSTTTMPPVLAALVDGEGRVGGAECRWGPEARSEDFLLVVPSDLAEAFARMPEVEVSFVRYRQVPASVEWLGRSEALSLRIAGVLRELTP